MGLAPDVAASRCTSRQHGLITDHQALDIGFSRRQIDHRLAIGLWLPADPRVYRPSSVPDSWSARVLAPCLSTGGFASHRSAAAIWGIGDVTEDPIDITVARPHRYRRDGVRVHESRDVHLAHPRLREGIPVSSVPRTLVDLGAVVGRDRVEEAVFDAIDRRMTTWTQLLACYLQHARQGRSGCGALRWVIDHNLDKAVPQSRLERLLERVVAAAGLPLPERQVEVPGVNGRVVRLDFAYRDRKIAIETDGRSTHARRRAFERDSLRRNRLELQGWTVLVFTWETLVGQPEVVVEQVQAALARPAIAA